MKNSICAILTATFILLLPFSTEASEPGPEPEPESGRIFEDLELNINVLWGRRIFGLHDNKGFSVDIDELRYQQVTGLEVDFGMGWWPVNIWLGYTESDAAITLSGYEFSSHHREYFVGARAYLAGLYISGAAANIGGDFTGEQYGDIRGVTVDEEIGLLLNAGIDFTILMLNAGVEARILLGTEKSDYILFAVKAGFHLE